VLAFIERPAKVLLWLVVTRVRVIVFRVLAVIEVTGIPTPRDRD